MKVKLRDMTPEQWDNWEIETCLTKIKCSECPFKMTSCSNILSRTSWLNNKDMFSDKFLNQEVEIEE